MKTQTFLDRITSMFVRGHDDELEDDETPEDKETRLAFTEALRPCGKEQCPKQHQGWTPK